MTTTATIIRTITIRYVRDDTVRARGNNGPRKRKWSADVITILKLLNAYTYGSQNKIYARDRGSITLKRTLLSPFFFYRSCIKIDV